MIVEELNHDTSPRFWILVAQTEKNQIGRANWDSDKSRKWVIITRTKELQARYWLIYLNRLAIEVEAEFWRANGWNQFIRYIISYKNGPQKSPFSWFQKEKPILQYYLKPQIIGNSCGPIWCDINFFIYLKYKEANYIWQIFPLFDLESINHICS